MSLRFRRCSRLLPLLFLTTSPSLAAPPPTPGPPRTPGFPPGVNMPVPVPPEPRKIPQGPSPTFSPAATQPADKDPQLKSHIAKLVAWLDTGTPEQQSLAADALRMSPVAAIPFLKAQVEEAHLGAKSALLVSSILKDHESYLQRSQADIALLATRRQDYAASYDTAGSHGPNWDKQARAILKNLYIDRIQIASAQPDLHALLQRGCTDPLIRHFAQRADYLKTQKVPPLADRITIAREILSTKYPPYIKYFVTQFTEPLAQESRSPEDQEALRKFVLEATSLILIPLKTDKLPAAIKTDIIISLAKLLASTYPDHGLEKGWALLEPLVLNAIPDNDEVAQTADSLICNTIAWEARGTGLAGDTPADAMARYTAYISKSGRCANLALAQNTHIPSLWVQKLEQLRNEDASAEDNLNVFHHVLEESCDEPSILSAIAQNRLPRWGGQPDEWRTLLPHLWRSAILSRNAVAGFPQASLYLMKLYAYEPEDAKIARDFWHSDDIRRSVVYSVENTLLVNSSQGTLDYALNAYLAVAEVDRARTIYVQLPPGHAADPEYFPMPTEWLQMMFTKMQPKPLPPIPPPTWVP